MRRRVAAVLLACFCGALSVVGQTNEITSENVVGYYKLTIPSNGGINLCGPALQSIDSTNQTLQGILGPQLRSGALPGLADVVKFWNGDGTFSSYARKTSDGLYHSTGDWWGPASNPALSVGQGVWLQSSAGATGVDLTIMGAVVSLSVTNLNIHPGYQLLNYPFSTDTSLHTWGLTNGTATAALGGSDHILTWNPSNSVYSTYVLRPGGIWTSMTAGASYTLYLGEGFWYYAQTNFVWTETNSYINNL